jgi:hypothetical protein
MEEGMSMTTFPHAIESARLSMQEAQKAPENHERLHRYVPSEQHTLLIRIFNKATETYLSLSANQR